MGIAGLATMIPQPGLRVGRNYFILLPLPPGSGLALLCSPFLFNLSLLSPPQLNPMQRFDLEREVGGKISSIIFVEANMIRI